MRTKILALSAVVGTLASVSAMAQTNVYSQNAVGYIQVTLYPGYNIVTCPLICSPDNTLNTLLPNTNGQYQIGSGRSLSGAVVFQYINGIGYVAGDTAKSSVAPGGWSGGGTNTLLPGQAIWFVNPGPTDGTGSNMLATFVGTVPQGLLTNTLYPGYNLVGSMVPASGDLITNSITAIGTNVASGTLSVGPTPGDNIYVYDPTYTGGAQGGYATGGNGSFSQNRQGKVSWNAFGASPDPNTTNVAEGFWYQSQAATPNNWVENFTINP
jgi:hypothetical protein